MALASSRAPTSRSGSGRSPYLLPFTLVTPASGASSPMIIRMVVDLPDPLGPRNPVTWPGFTSKDRSSTATVSWYRFVTPLTSITIWSPRRCGLNGWLGGHHTRWIHDDGLTQRKHQASG